MAAYLINLVIVIVIGKCIWDSFLKPHINYWWCFRDNIQGLSDQVQKLGRQISNLKQRIDAARLHVEVVRPEVEEWLNASTEKLEQARRIMPGDNIPKAWNLISRYSLGKNAKETAEEIAKHLNNGKFDVIADPAPSAAMASPTHSSITDFESRKGIEEDIIKSLKESNVYVIGICGMGGVGKTTMAQKIWKRVKDANLFQEVVMVTVSQKMNVAKIQNDIADLLKLKFEESSMAARAHQLRTRLMDPMRKIIILDDLWESLKFDDLGVPFESDRCKILLTTRSKDVCKRMKAQKIIAMKILSKEEAWILFREKAGKCAEESALRDVAKDVVTECKGLPIALVTIGMVLQNQQIKSIWVDSLSQLRGSNPADFPEILKDVYKPLKLSYDFLHNREQYLLLMCCLFPEDYNIPVELLAWYSMGLRLFQDITNIEEVRNRTIRLVDNLKSRFLLIDGRNKIQVKMHDVVRDVAIYIGTTEKDGFLKSLHRSSIENSSDVNCNWMCVDISNEQMEVPVLSRFPKLQLLMWSSKAFYDISRLSFEGKEDLKVLSFEHISIGSLPPTLGSLKNLQTLRLVQCEVENISVVGKLTSLKIFSCNGCRNIAELPAEIGRLKGLRLLELNYCRKLQRIPLGVISNLRRLEELKIRGSFMRWEAEEKGKERRNASLKELECLRNLSCLEIEIDDCTLSAREICLSQNLVKYYIRIGSASGYYYFSGDYEKVMILNLPGAIGNWIRLLARNAEFLILKGDGSDNIFPAQMKNLRNLEFTNCSTVKKLVDTINGIVFPSLEVLRMDTLGNLQEICDRNHNVSLCNLKSIEIISCLKLRSLFSVAKTSLLQLEVLEIQNCAAMEQVFWNEGTDDNTNGRIEFPKLKKLTLKHLPNLTAFCLPKLHSLFPLNSETVGRHDQNTSLHFVCNPKNVSFGNLKSINIFECPKLRYLSSVAKTSLLQLEVLDIQFCYAMEQVFWNEGTDDNTAGCIEFSKLKELTLTNLPNLTAFCQGLEKESIKFPNLTKMDIGGLPSLKDSVFPLSSEIPCNLKSIKIENFSNLKHLFSGSVARTIVLQLEVLSISSCDAMEQVFWNEITEDNTDGCIEFPKLNELRLTDLPNLTAFCQGLENKSIKFSNLMEMDIGGLPELNSLYPLNSETVVVHDPNTSLHFFCNPKDVSFANLKSIYIFGCNQLRSLFSVSAPRTCLLQLEVLEIGFCYAMEELFWNEGTDDKTYSCFEFPKLKTLTLQNLPNLTAFWQGLESKSIKFPNLTKMEIRRLPKLNNSKDVSCGNLKSIYICQCPKLRYLFSVSAVRTSLLQLEFLEIVYCDGMEQLFWNEGTADNTDGCIEFPKLKQLKLGGLSKLNSLYPLNSETVVGHDHNTSLHFFCNPKVEMSCLRNVTLSNFNIRNIWCHQIPNNVFNNLNRLYINSMNCIKSLMSTSIAKNLMNLKYLEISDCGELVEVIERDEDDDKQVVDFKCLFPTLIQLNMRRLPKLKKFWQWNHELELPLLQCVNISCCPIMETFTLGSISTPNILGIEINHNFHMVRDQKYLNDVLRHIWTKSQDKSKADGDGDGDGDGNKNGNENENKD